MSDTEGWQEVGGRRVQPGLVAQQCEALFRLKKVLEEVIDREKKNVAVVREQLHRMKYGGGS